MNTAKRPYSARTGNQLLPPEWLQKYRHGSHAVRLQERNDCKVVDLGQLTLSIPDCNLPEGTQMEVWLGSDGFFYCDTKEAITQREQAYIAEQQAKEQKRRDKCNVQRDRALAFNATIKLPVLWVVGQKDVLSGLSERSMGNGRDARSVDHILLQQDLKEHRLKRNTGDFLCTSASGSNGKRWSSTISLTYDGDGSPYPPIISCAACLKAASRWITQ